MSRLAWIALVAAGIAGAYFAVLFLAQRTLLFPMPVRTLPESVAGAEIVRLKIAGGEAVALLLAASRPPPVPLVIFMHGNGELADDWVPIFSGMTTWGVAVMLAEYPGYGRAPGAPSERAITSAVHALFDWAAGDPRFDSTRIVAYGRSLGGGAAARLASDRKVAALVLESAFTSVADFAGRMLAPRFLVRDRFDTRAALGSFRGPLLVIHGNRDTIVPIAHGRQLAAIVPGARFHELDCGHNDCPRQGDLIRAFLRESHVLD